MRYTAILLLLFFISCGSRKETQYETEAMEEAITKTSEEENGEKGLAFINGTIRDQSQTQGCDFLIEVAIEGEKTLLSPLDLSETFKVDGKQVKLIYRMSRRPSTCEFATPIVIDQILER